MITKDNFMSARYSDNDRTIIEVLLKTDNDKKGEWTPYIIEHNESHPDFKDLMKVTSIPEIHQYTDDWCNQQRKRFKDELIDIAKKEGIIKGEKIKEIQVEAKLETMFKKIFVDNIDYDNDDIKEDMFKTKLMAFELPNVKSSTNRELKTKLRKVETFKDLIDIVLKF